MFQTITCVNKLPTSGKPLLLPGWKNPCPGGKTPYRGMLFVAFMIFWRGWDACITLNSAINHGTKSEFHCLFLGAIGIYLLIQVV